jgi:hypothetical protein
MATNFPSSLDSLTNPSAGDPTTNPSHAAQHANANDAIEALEAKVGIDNSAVTTSLDYRMGLQFIKSQVVGTAVSSVTVTNAFSSTYDNYLITWSGGTMSLSAVVNFTIGGSATGYYNFMAYGDAASTTILGAGTLNGANFPWGGGAQGGQAAHFRLDVFGPNLAAYTKLLNGTYQNGQNYGTVQGEHRVATAYTSFAFAASSGTMTGGTIRVYGYKN